MEEINVYYKVEREFHDADDFEEFYGYKYPAGILDGSYGITSTIRQMLYAGDEDDTYVILVNILESLNFDIRCNILDVASGYYPAFGYEIAGRQLQLNKGTVTCIDPRIVVDKPFFNNVKLVKENFTDMYDLSNYDLIVSSLPCEITEELFRAVMNSGKPFFICPCNCHSNKIGKKLWEEMYEFCLDYEKKHGMENKTKIFREKVYYKYDYIDATKNSILYRK